MIGNDVGVIISTTRGRQWTTTRLPIGQIYHVTTDNRIPYFVYGQMQDDGSMRGPSNSPGGYGILPAEWTSTAGCETGWATPDPVDPNIVWGGCYAGVIERFDARTGMTRSVSPWPERTMGANAGQIKLRMNWTFPIAISPHDHNAVYVGSQFVHKTTDGGQTWTAISPDLTTNDPMMMGDSGGLTVDNLSVEYAGVVYLDRGVAEGEGRHLGRHQRRAGPGHARRRRALGERHARPSGPAAPRNGRQRRAFPFRRRHLLRRRRPPPGRQPRPLPLQDGRLRQDLEGDRLEHPEEPALLRARRARGPVPAGASSTRARRTPSTCPSTTAGGGSRCRRSFRTRRSTG